MEGISQPGATKPRNHAAFSRLLRPGSPLSLLKQLSSAAIAGIITS